MLDRLRRRGCNFWYCLLTKRQGVAPASPATALGCAGKDWSLDADFEGAGQQVQRGYLGMLSVDSLLAFMGSVEKLVDIAVEQGGHVPPALSKGPGSGGWAGAWAGGQSRAEQVELQHRRGNEHWRASKVFSCPTSCPKSSAMFRGLLSHMHFLSLIGIVIGTVVGIVAGAVARIEVDVCKGMVERTWRGMLAVISQLLLRSSGEELVLQLLKVRDGARSGQAAPGSWLGRSEE